MDEGTIIYVIIGIVALVVSALKKKKNQNIPIDLNENNSQENSFSLEDLYKPESFVFPSEESEYEIIDPPKPAVKKQRIVYERLKETIENEKKNNIKKQENESEKDTSFLSKASINFNLRDAIIYSEIINRKEY